MSDGDPAPDAVCSVRSSPELRCGSTAIVCPAVCAVPAVRCVRTERLAVQSSPASQTGNPIKVDPSDQLRLLALCAHPAPPDRRGKGGCSGKRDRDQTETWRDGPLLAQRSVMSACVPCVPCVPDQKTQPTWGAGGGLEWRAERARREQGGGHRGPATEGGNDPWEPGGEGVGKLLHALGDT